MTNFLISARLSAGKALYRMSRKKRATCGESQVALFMVAGVTFELDIKLKMISINPIEFDIWEEPVRENFELEIP
ncbi:hypothetical protein FYZ48_25410 [Gimesia chilikensis]|uniref:hypothetical protein n=1 Tax=Gimesia chilikensis TaxID=2605989 RepID=UPI0011EDF96F|nr:hypothetical protein [Gimesia chilikensis]KAA0131485.1 hypothetical protein FYZ48_25410 [Gimesia chilikensis]